MGAREREREAAAVNRAVGRRSDRKIPRGWLLSIQYLSFLGLAELGRPRRELALRKTYASRRMPPRDFYSPRYRIVADLPNFLIHGVLLPDLRRIFLF